MNLTAIFIAALSLAQPQAQVDKPASIQTCQSLSKEMDTILATKTFGSLEMDRELSGPRLQYIKMNCKDGKPTNSADIIFTTLFGGGVDAPQFNPEFGFGDGAAVATRITVGSIVESEKRSMNTASNKGFGCNKHLSEECNLLEVNAIDGIL